MRVAFDPAVLEPDPTRRRTLLDLLTTALLAVDPERLTAAAVRRLDIASPVTVIALGKAAPGMARGAAAVLGASSGLVVTDHPEEVPAGYELVVGDHPLPGKESVRAGRRALEVAARSQLPVLFLISGGGSALCELPAPGLELADLVATTRLLLASGAGIDEINLVRRHLSAVKGGRLGAVAGSVVATLVLSDVPSGQLGTVSSGPTVAEPSTPDDALRVIKRYRLPSGRPVMTALERSSPAPRPRPHPLVRVADGQDAAAAARDRATAIGLRAIVAPVLTGEASTQALAMVESSLPGITIAAGETTVRVTGNGRGGRNQHAALAAAIHLDGNPEVVFAALATDGVDGPTTAAGAIVDGTTCGRARALGLDPGRHLAESDAYPLLMQIGDGLRCGPTGTNVADLWVVWRS